MKTQKPLTHLLSQAWVTKVNQEHPRFALLWAEIEKLIGVNPTCLERKIVEKLEENFGSPDTVSLLALQSSLFRMLGQPDRAKALMELCAEIIRKEPTASRFYYEYEWALIHYAAGEFQKAMDFDLQAVQCATSPHQKAWALTDILLCAENLGLPQEYWFRELETALSKVKSPELIISVHQQLRAYRMRRAFRHGDFPNCLTVPVDEPIGQEFYYRIWVQELPYYHYRTKPGTEEFQRFASIHRHFKDKPYRIRTLTGELHPEDLKQFRWTEFCDRIYLWTWRWLTDPEQFPVASVLTLLNSINLETMDGHLTTEDRLMLSNVLGWLGLFDFPSQKELGHFRKSLEHPHFREFPLLNRESSLISFWESALKQDQITPDWARSEKLPFSELLPGNPPPRSEPLLKLKQALESLIPTQEKNVAEETLIDLDHFQIENRRTGKKLHSEAVVRGFEALHFRPQMNIADFARQCLDVVRYDPDSHLRRIFHLLSRMRAFAPAGLEFHLKSGVVFSSGPWERIRFRRQSRTHRAFRNHPLWIRFLTQIRKKYRDQRPVPAAGSELLRSYPVLRDKKSITRSDLISVTGKPRSTVLRLIHHWVTQGELIRHGKGRSIRYTLPNNQ